MQDRGKVISVFLVLFLISLLFFIFSKVGILKLNFVSGIFSPIQKELHISFFQLTKIGASSEIEKIKEENKVLTQKLIDQQKLVNQNKALLDQFQQVYPKSTNLIPADVIGSPGFIPGVSVPELLIINKGLSDGVEEGDPVIVKNNLVGKVAKALQATSVVYPVGNNSFSFAAKVGVDKKALGIVSGQGGGEMILDNVLLSETIKVGDVVLTNGDIEQSIERRKGGFPPDLIIGKIISVEKNPSALFQKADVLSLVNLSKLSVVFIQIQNK